MKKMIALVLCLILSMLLASCRETPASESSRPSTSNLRFGNNDGVGTNTDTSVNTRKLDKNACL